MTTDAITKSKTQIPEGYINLTELAKKADKDLRHWTNAKVGREAISMFSMCYPDIERPVIAKRGRGACTWAHPEVAAMFASWCNIAYAGLLQRFLTALAPKKPFQLSDLHPLAEVQFRNAIHERVYGYGCMGSAMANISRRRRQPEFHEMMDIATGLDSASRYRNNPLEYMIDNLAVCGDMGLWDVIISSSDIQRFEFFTQEEKEGMATILERKIYNINPGKWIGRLEWIVGYMSSKNEFIDNPAKAIGYGMYNVAKELDLLDRFQIPTQLESSVKNQSILESSHRNIELDPIAHQSAIDASFAYIDESEYEMKSYEEALKGNKKDLPDSEGFDADGCPLSAC